MTYFAIGGSEKDENVSLIHRIFTSTVGVLYILGFRCF